MASDSKAGKKIADVAKPGESAPDATAKPIIVGHGSMLKEDPMVSGNKATDKDGEAEQGEKLVSKSEIVIEASDDIKPEEDDKPEEKVNEEELSGPENTDGQAGLSDQAAVDAVAKQADKDKRKGAEPTDEEKARAIAIQKLIDDKKYNVSVSATRGQRNAMHTLIILLILVVLAVLATYLLIDAKIIDVGVSVPVEFIK